MIEPGKAQAINVLTEFGFRVEEIPESNEPNQSRADLLVSDDESHYVIEVKDKGEGDERRKERHETLGKGEVFSETDALARDNSISGVLIHARDQLDATPKPPNAFQLIWLYSAGVAADTKFRQTQYTFYGIRHLICRDDNSGMTTDCLYFDYCTAFNMPTVEAVILTDKQNLSVCLNEFSTRAAEFRASALYTRFKEVRAIFDPVELVEQGLFTAFRSPMPRKNDDDILAAITAESGKRYIAVDFNRHSCSVTVNPSEY